MRGFPKHINTKEDLDLCQKEYPEKTQEWLQKKIEGIPQWFPVGKVQGAGIVDATHKVVEEKSDATAKVEQVQYELRDDPNSPIVKLGLTRADAEQTVTELKAVISPVSIDEKPVSDEKVI